MDAAAPTPRTVGLLRLVAHCEALDRLTGDERTSARSRLDDALGHELATWLVGALTRPRGCAAA
jgi:hypothetical protein